MRDGVHRFGRVVAGAALLVAGVARTAAAQPEDDAPPSAPPPADLESLFGGSSSCPRPDLVRAELATLLPPERLNARLRAFPGTPAVVELYDLGVPFRVVAAGRVREYRDEARDCAYRARVAAVFVALTIDPASVGVPPPPAPPRTEPPPTIVEAPPAPPTPPAARLDVAAAVDAGFGSDRVAHGGAAVRLTVGRGRYGFAAGALLLVPADTTVGGVRLRQWRLPMDAGVRRTITGLSFTPYAELGLGVAILSESALDLAASSKRTAVEIGARAAVGARFGTSRFAPFAALHAELVPSPPAIFALPQGELGHTPTLWIGAIAGASVGL